MAAKPTRGGIWLREQRLALGLTADGLGGALGVAGNTIRAVECGARSLSATLRARAEAFIANEVPNQVGGRRRLPPDDLVRMVAWVHPGTMAACLREAKRRGLDFELVLGSWADRSREDAKGSLERAIVGALGSTIDDHGPITRKHIGNAAKRILGNIANARIPGKG